MASVLRKTVDPVMENAYLSASLAQVGLLQSWTYYQAIHQEHQALLAWNSGLNTTEVELHILHQAVLEQLDHDLQTTSLLNQNIATHKQVDAIALNFPLNTNKMEIILEGAKEILSDYNQFEAIATGHFPEGFQDAPAFPVIIGEANVTYGDSKATFLSAALIEVAVSLHPTENGISDLYGHLNKSLDESPLAHVVPLETCLLNEEFLSAYEDYTFKFQDELTPFGLTYIHSGYAFGGYRDEERYEDAKVFGPEDCSSWIAKLCGCEHLFSTVDQLYTYRAVTDNGGYVESTWLESEVAKEMLATFKPVEILDPWQDIQAGQIMTIRKFEDADHLQDSGFSGHTVLVLGLTDDEQLVTLNYTRNMPEQEGFGISLFDWQSTDLKDVMFFELTETASPLTLEDLFETTPLLSFLEDHQSIIPNHQDSMPLPWHMPCPVALEQLYLES